MKRKQERLDLLCRLRGMHVEQARAEHVAAQAELDEKREQAEDTQRRLAALDSWADAQLAAGAPLLPETLLHAQLYRSVEKQTLEQQRFEEEHSRERTEETHSELAHKFKELSVVERLSARQLQLATHEELRKGYVNLDEAGTQSKNLETKE